jgi:hypothetical protein
LLWAVEGLTVERKLTKAAIDFRRGVREELAFITAVNIVA